MPKPGKLVLAERTYYDAKAGRAVAKRRPAVVISSAEYEKTTNNVVCLQVTSIAPRDEFDIQISDWDTLGLAKKSCVRCGKLFHAEVADLRTNPKLTELPPELQNTVLEKVRNGVIELVQANDLTVQPSGVSTSQGA